MKLLFLDFETQCDQAETTNITEIGTTIVHVKETSFGTELEHPRSWSQLVYEPDYPPQPDFIVELTGITDEMLKAEGCPRGQALGNIALDISTSDYVLAHNKKFDQTVYESTCRRLALPVATPIKGWICTLQDIPWPEKFRCKQLAHLAFDHGVHFDKADLHRAGDDTELLSRLVLEHYDIRKIIKYWAEPWVYLRAKIPGPWKGPGGDGGIGKAQATKLGYSWEKAKYTDGPVFAKAWVKRVKESEIQKEKERAPFPITRLEYKPEPEKELIV